MKKPNVLPADSYEARPMWAVFFRRKDGSEFIASGSVGGPAVYEERERAMDLRHELRPLFNTRVFVRPVLVTVSPVWP